MKGTIGAMLVGTLVAGSSLAKATATEVTRPALSGAGPVQVRLDEAVEARLFQEGLDLLADYLVSEGLDDLEGEALPDTEESLPGGITLELDDMRAWLRFADARVEAKDGFLEIHLALADVRLEAGEMQVWREVFGVPVSTTCHDTTVIFSGDDPVTAEATLTAEVKDERVGFSTRSTEFAIPEDDYEVEGPERCSGGLGIGWVTRYIVAGLLRQARSFFEDKIAGRVSDAVPRLEDRVNESLRQSFPISVPGIPGTGMRRDAVVVTNPHDLQVTDGRFALTLAVALEQTSSTRAVTFPVRAEEGPWLGGVGVNPGLLTEAFSTLFPQGTPLVELGEDLAPGLEEVLSVSSASSIWPDLGRIELGRDHLRVWARVSEAPQFVVRNEPGTVGVRLPRIDLHFQAHRNGSWRDYYTMELTVASGFVPAEEGGVLSLELTRSSTVAVDGAWAEDYDPLVPRVEQDVAAMLFQSIMDYLYASGPLWEMGVPIYQVAGRPVTVGQVSLESPFVRLTLREAGR